MSVRAGELELLMFANLARLQKDMNDAHRMVKDTAERLEKVLGVIGVGFGAHELIEKVDSVIDQMEKLELSSVKTGASIENLSKLQFFAGVSGTSLDGVTSALEKLSKGMAMAGNETAPTSQALKFLGLTAKDAAGNLKDPSELFGEIAKKLVGYEDGAGKAAIAQALFGKAGAEMLPTLAKMAELGDVEAAATKEQVAAAVEYRLEVARLNQQKEILWNTVVGALLPTMKDFVDVLLDASKQSNSLGGVAKGLAEDNSIEKWADAGAMGLARLIDVIKIIPDLLSAVKLSFEAAATDVETLGVRMRLIASFFTPGGISKAEGDTLMKQQVDKQTAAALAANTALAKTWNMQGNEMEQAMQKRIADRKAFQGFMSGMGIDSQVDDAMFGGGDSKKKLNFNVADAKAAAAELKLYQGAVKRLEDELGGLYNLTEAQKLQFALYGENVEFADGTIRHLVGSLETLSPAHKKIIEYLGLEVDRRKQAIEASKLAIGYIETLNKAREAEQAIVRSTLQANVDYSDDLKFQIGLIGKSAIEQEKLNETRKIDLKLRADIRSAAEAAGEDTDLFFNTMVRLEEQAKNQKAAVLDSVNARLQAERSWEAGATSAFNDYIDHATNAAEQSKNLFTHAFQSMEDALVDLAMKGKVDFKSLADSIISDLIRIQIRASITAPLAQSLKDNGGIFGALGKLFGLGGSSALDTGGSGGNDAEMQLSSGGYEDFYGNLVPRANGGPVSAGRGYMVGERGPEFFSPSTNGTIVPNSESTPQIVIHQNMTFGSDVTQSTLRAWGSVIKAQTIAAVADRTRDGGQYSKAVRG